jgi:hypothetical protein
VASDELDLIGDYVGVGRVRNIVALPDLANDNQFIALLLVAADGLAETARP